MWLTSVYRRICIGKRRCLRSKPASTCWLKSQWLSTQLECDAILDAANRTSQVFMVAQVLRFWPEYVALRKMLEANPGDSRREALFYRRCGVPDWSGWLSDEARSGGAILDLLVHDIDQALHLFGMPDSVSAGSLGPVDTLDASLYYSDGSSVSIQGGWYRAGEPFAMGFHVTTGEGGLDLKDGVSSSKKNGEWRTIELAASAMPTKRSFLTSSTAVAPAVAPKSVYLSNQPEP